EAAPRYVVRAAPSDDLDRDAPALPDLGPYSVHAVRERMPTPTGGRVSLQRMVDLEAVGEFVSGAQKARLGEWAARQNTNPQVIVVDSGRITLQQVAAQVSEQLLEQTSAGVYLLRLPLL